MHNIFRIVKGTSDKVSFLFQYAYVCLDPHRCGIHGLVAAKNWSIIVPVLKCQRFQRKTTFLSLKPHPHNETLY